MLEIVHGNPMSPGLIADATTAMKQAGIEGTLYLGYPVISTVDEHLIIDAMLISRTCSPTIILGQPNAPGRTSAREHSRRQDEAFLAVQNHLLKVRELREGRNLAVPLKVVTLVPTKEEEHLNCDPFLVTPERIADAIRLDTAINDSLMRHLNAALQRIATLRPKKKRASVAKPDSRGAKLRQIENAIANLDQYQKRAALESPHGPQRIRGLAGTGKTVVLALKAAYLHARYPEWRIGVTFFTRALYQQIQQFVLRFFREHSESDPDFDILQILHAWGSAGKPGVYTTFADLMNHPSRDFGYARATFGYHAAFSGICEELLQAVEHSPPEPVFDAFLIDEAQDLPPSFFKLVYAFTKDPKRIVWAYDELQNLSSEEGLAPVTELFGKHSDGNPRVVLSNEDGQPRQDVILPICYRNTPWTLTAAHALGFGIYSDGGLVQHFDDPEFWEQIGYTLLEGALAAGERVRLKRSEEATPQFFTELLDPSDAFLVKMAKDEQDQATWVAAQIKLHLETDELDADDIAVILPRPLTAKKSSLDFQRSLQRIGIRSHIVGQTVSADEMFVPGSVAITHAFRAKGNEAPMVYVVNAQECAGGIDLALSRNALFACMTRSRAWLRIVGYGPGMRRIERECRAVVERDFVLEFTIPTLSQLKEMRSIHRDMSEAEKKQLINRQKQAVRSLDKLLQSDIPVDLLDPEVLQKIEELRKRFESS